MAALTWRNVDGPDYRSAMDGYRGFSDSLTNAFTGLQRGIEKFDERKSDAVNQLVQAQLLQYQDPEAYKAALQSGELINALGSNAARLDGRTIQAMGDHVGTLMEQQYKGLQAKDLTADIDFKGYTRDRAKDENASLDAMKPYASRILSGDPTLDKDAGYIKARDGLSIDKLMDIEKNKLGLRTGEASLAGQLIGNQAAQFRLTVDKRDDAEAQAIKALGGQLMGLGTEDDVMAALQNVPANLRGPAYMYYRGLNLDNGSSGGGVGGGSTGGTSTGEAFDMVLGNGQYGRPSKPLTSMTMGEAQDFGRNVLIPNSRAAGVGRGANGRVLGSSAMGAYQITQSTLEEFAPKVLGANWKNLPFSAENQDKIAEAIFNSSKNGNLKLRWEGLPDTRPGAYANKSWDEMRHIIAKVESKPFVWQPNGAQLASNNITTALTTNVSGDRNAELLASYQKLAGDSSSDAAVATKYTSKGGAFAGMDRGSVLSQIQNVRQRFGVNAAVAADILERSATQQGFFGRNTSWLSGNSSGLTFDDDLINQYGNQFKNGAQGLRNTGTRVGVQSQAAVAAANAPALVQKLTDDIRTLQRRGQRSPVLEAQLAEAQAKLGGTIAGTAQVAAAGRRSLPGDTPAAPSNNSGPGRTVLQQRADTSAQRAREAAEKARTAAANARQATENLRIARERLANGGTTVAQRDAARQNARRAAESADRQAVVDFFMPNQAAANPNAERMRLRNVLNGMDDMLARGGTPVGTTRAQLLAQRNAIASQIGIPSRR